MNRTLASRVAIAAVIVIGGLGCRTVDVDAPIALVPSATWTPSDIDVMARAAECWNLALGTQVTVGDPGGVDQLIDVVHSDFLCVASLGRVDPTDDLKMSICPPEYYAPDSLRDWILLQVVTHEIGHVLNIRDHVTGRDDAIMASTLSGERRISDADRALFVDANPEFTPSPACRDVALVHARPPSCACVD